MESELNPSVTEYCIYYKGQYLTYAEVAVRLLKLDEIIELVKN